MTNDLLELIRKVNEEYRELANRTNENIVEGYIKLYETDSKLQSND